jgi:hypothetical protein
LGDVEVTGTLNQPELALFIDATNVHPIDHDAQRAIVDNAESTGSRAS